MFPNIGNQGTDPGSTSGDWITERAMTIVAENATNGIANGNLIEAGRAAAERPIMPNLNRLRNFKTLSEIVRAVIYPGALL